ncbi:CoA-disulfide reductase [uncultured Fusobacterium sp.]|uniref:CoA-disulfide reductase n=1 Tax=uncultured Fusobacterium sp. TaxID=159267 RepID=UPI002611259E|nr:CoA-disulfide reductase [uncultured Fusobacterium sp.]
MNKKIIIIGGVAAGMSAASKAKRIDKSLDITVYEMTNAISWGACGLPYYVGDFYPNASLMVARTYEEFQKEGINLKIKHKVENIDFKNKKVFVRNLNENKVFEDNYDELVIATGASSTSPKDIKNLDAEGVYHLKTFNEGLEVKKEIMKKENENIIIIGAGYIGIEIAEAALKLGKNVRIFQHSARILNKTFDKEITDLLENHIREHEKIFLHLNESPLEVKTFDNKVIGLKTDKNEYSANLIIVATGVRPNTEFLKDSGLELFKNGAIIIDRFGKTNIPDVYAAGDCTTVYHSVLEKNVYIALATTANKLGRLIGENLTGANKKFIGTLGSAGIKVLEFEAARTGITEQEAKDNNINYKTVFIDGEDHSAYYPDGEDIYIKLIYNVDTKILLGAQVAGKKGAALRANSLAVAIQNKMTVTDLANMDFLYAPPFSTTWDIMNVAANVAK